MNVQNIKRATIDKDGSAIVELSGKELRIIETFLGLGQKDYGFNNDTEFELYVNVCLTQNLVYEGNVHGIYLSSLQKILSDQKKQKLDFCEVVN